MITVRTAQERGKANFGWLDSRHTFSFGRYYDPDQLGFSDLLVINDDRVQPGKGFGTHSHQNMEIFSYVLDGALEHRDSMGTGSIIRPGDIQMMSAGTGITHSEMNPSEEQIVHFLQIWIVPDRKNVTPRYQQVHFPPSKKRGRLRLIISPDAGLGTLSVYQDVRVYAGLIDGAETATFDLSSDRYAYLHVARGQIRVNDHLLTAGDGARIKKEKTLAFTEGRKAEVLLFDLRPIERPVI